MRTDGLDAEGLLWRLALILQEKHYQQPGFCERHQTGNLF